MKIKTMNLILIILGILIVIFTTVMIAVYVTQGSVPDSLIYSFFGAITGEAGFMGLIKSTRIRQEQQDCYQAETKATQEDNHQGRC